MPTCPHRLRSFLLQVAVNCVAGAIPAAFLLLLGMPLKREAILNSLAIGVVFANSIGIPASFAIQRMYPAVARRGPVFEWTSVSLALTGLGILGCLIGTVLLGLLRIFHWSGLWIDLRGNMLLCVLITLAFGLVITAFSRLRGRLDQEELARERALKLASEAQLASLESRLHPHFLFNTLNSVSSLIPVDPERAERLIERMSALLRFSLDAHAHGLVPVAQEMKIVSDYLEIEQARLGPRLRFTIDSSAVLDQARVPPLSVQTLVENSVKYAIAPDRQGGEIRVRAHQANGDLHIDVADSGPGFSLETVPAGHGLDNLRNRLAMLFDGKASLRVSRLDGWTTVGMILPREAAALGAA
jgi:sensor histidine kinase YesM